MIFVTAFLPLRLNFDLFEVLDYLPSLPLVSFEFALNTFCVVTQDNGKTTSSNPKVAIRLFEVSPQSSSVERACKAERVIHIEIRQRHSNVTVQMLLYLCVNLHLLNKLTSEMGNFFTDAMRDSNSHEFEKMVDPITCMPNGESEESLGEIDETLTETGSSVTTAFSWSNVSSQDRRGVAKRSKIEYTVVVIDSTPASPK